MTVTSSLCRFYWSHLFSFFNFNRLVKYPGLSSVYSVHERGRKENTALTAALMGLGAASDSLLTDRDSYSLCRVSWSSIKSVEFVGGRQMLLKDRHGDGKIHLMTPIKLPELG